jgi:hypothetical protein
MTTFKLTHSNNGIVPNQICTLCNEETEFNPHTELCDECFQDELDMHEQGASSADFDYGFFVASVDKLTGVKKKCRLCDGEIFANHIHAICDCDLPF